MRRPVELQRDLVLVGGGHSHALALRMLAMQPLQGLRITLISPASHTPYSGMLPGLVAGHYNFDETHIDLARLCQWAGVRFIEAAVTAVDPEQRRLSLAGRPAIGYDIVSLDIGSEPDMHSVPGADRFATPVKPVASLWGRWQALERRLREVQSDTPCRIGLVGGGAGSVELAVAMSRRLGAAADIELWCGAAHILKDYNRRARGAVMAALHGSGVRVHLDARVVEVESGKLRLADGRAGEFDALFWCTAAAAAPWIAASGLPTDEQGFLAVNEYLQSTADPRVFAAGDIAAMSADPRPKAGVYAVRQAPVLAHNLRASFLHEPMHRSLRRYRPQRRFLSLLSLGEKRATADRGWFSATGSWVWRWKDRIDRTFMRQFQELPQRMEPASAEGLAPAGPAEDHMICGGCGAKVGADVLSSVLNDLERAYPAHCRGGGDDAVEVLDAGAGRILQSLDVLREIVADPWLMGRIAANHALSDLFACGVKPVSALAAVTLPFASPRILQRDLEQILSGAVVEFAAADCVLNGGHSMQGSEQQLGFAVTGVPMRADAPLLQKSGARPGDRLVLTKPLGTGALFAAHMRGAADGRDIRAAVDTMLASNGRAAELALEHGASACTDITGFGLQGHLLEMLGENLGASIVAAALPLLQGVQQALVQGITSTMAPANRASGELYLNASLDLEPAVVEVCFDPQTSGGLLIAVASDRAEALYSDLLEAGYSGAAVIGVVQAQAQAQAPGRVTLS